jgi:hypothetical protein
VLSTPLAFGPGAQKDLVADHAYQVTGVQSVDGKPCALLHNPWNLGDPKPVPLDLLRTSFSAVSVGSVK